MTRGTNDSLIDQIVAQVLSQLRARSGSAKNSSNGNARAEAIANQPGQPSFVTLPDQVVTEELLRNHARPGAAVRISGKAILTPTARDYIKAHGISLHREQPGFTAKDTVGFSQGIIIASYFPEIVQSLLTEVRKQWKSFWRIEIEAGISQVVAKGTSVICRGESCQALVFAKTPHQAACLVNRNAECRATVVRNATDVYKVREELKANVLCVDLGLATYTGLRGILRASMETAGLVQDGERSQS